MNGADKWHMAVIPQFCCALDQVVSAAANLPSLLASWEGNSQRAWAARVDASIPAHLVTIEFCSFVSVELNLPSFYNSPIHRNVSTTRNIPFRVSFKSAICAHNENIFLSDKSSTLSPLFRDCWITFLISCRAFSSNCLKLFLLSVFWRCLWPSITTDFFNIFPCLSILNENNMMVSKIWNPRI